MASQIATTLLKSRGAMVGGYAINKAISLLQKASIVILDVDSTIIKKEGMDMLATYVNKEKEIKELKQNGTIPFTSFVDHCLNIMKPSMQICADCCKQQPFELVDHAKDFIDTCKKVGKEVYLVSGGYEPMILPLLPILHIEKSHLYAIPLLFDENGAYVSYDKNAPTAYIDGKAKVVEILRRDVLGGRGVIVNIGDGILDANAYPASDAFIGFTGVCFKKRAIEKSMLYVDNFKDLIEIINNS